TGNTAAPTPGARERPMAGSTAAQAPGARERPALDRALGARLAAIDLPGPLLAVDLDAFDANTTELLRRADGRPLRLATKSVRVPALVERALAAGFEGLMTYSLSEALWWSARVDDVLMGYPTVDRTALAALAADPHARRTVTLMVDDVAHLAPIAAALGAEASGARAPGARPTHDARPSAGGGHVTAPTSTSRIRVCLDIDASLRVGPLHLGVRRSPLRTPQDAAALAREAERRGIEVRGVMFYE